MSCYNPVDSLYLEKPLVEGARKIIFNSSRLDVLSLSRYESVGYQHVNLPCGKCVGCALKRSLDWACRLLCEKQTLSEKHNINRCSFITLTYDNEHLPSDGCVSKRDFQLFMKRLRKVYDEVFGVKLKFFGVGEYGSQFGRPHYHAIIFGCDFKEVDDLLNNFKFKQNRLLISSLSKKYPGVCTFTRMNSESTYDSPLLSAIWKCGRVAVGSVTAHSVAYCARYSSKKMLTGLKCKDYYVVKYKDGSKREVASEFLLMSKGLGKEFFLDYYSSIYAIDSVRFIDRTYQVPRAFDKWFKKYYPDKFETVKSRRELKMQDEEFIREHMPERLKVKEEIQLAKYRKLIRGYELTGDFFEKVEEKLAA